MITTKDGNLDLLKPWWTYATFRCRSCEWEGMAEIGDTVNVDGEDDPKDGTYAEIACPCCGRTVTAFARGTKYPIGAIMGSGGVMGPSKPTETRYSCVPYEAFSSLGIMVERLHESRATVEALGLSDHLRRVGAWLTYKWAMGEADES